MTEQSADKLKHMQVEKFNKAYVKKDDDDGIDGVQDKQKKEQDYEMER